MSQFSPEDAYFMCEAFKEAAFSLSSGDVPVGALLCRGNEIIARAHNEKELRMDPTAHAEILVLRKAAEKLGRWQLNDCTIYVSLEPCSMCAAAMIQARIGRLVYAASDPKTGAAGGFTDLFALPHNHRPEVSGGLLADAGSRILKKFFQKRRDEQKTEGGRGARRRKALAGAGLSPEATSESNDHI